MFVCWVYYFRFFSSSRIFFLEKKKKTVFLKALRPKTRVLCFIPSSKDRIWERQLHIWQLQSKLHKSKALANSMMFQHCSLPIGSMYGIFTYIWLSLMVNVGKKYHKWILSVVVKRDEASACWFLGGPNCFIGALLWGISQAKLDSKVGTLAGWHSFCFCFASIQ